MHTLRPANPLTRLIADSAQFDPDDRVLLLNGDDPMLIALMGDRAAAIDVYVERAGTLEMLQTAIRRDLAAEITLYPAPFPMDSIDPGYDTAVIILPKGRDYGRALLWTARQALLPGGILYMVGGNDDGIKSLIADAEKLFDGANTLTTYQRCRIAASIQPDEPAVGYPRAWGDSPMVFQQRSIAGLDLMTLPGLFSWKTLDQGTAILLEALTESANKKDRVLDVGCGYGVIGVYMIVHGLADRVTMTDDQLAAVQCASLNSNTHGNGRIDVLAGDLFGGLPASALGTFDRIVANPPFHQGFTTDDQMTRRLIREANRWLKPTGRLTIVGNTFLRYDRLLTEAFAEVTTLRENPHYTVWDARTALSTIKSPIT